MVKDRSFARVLVATDFSTGAARALGRAALLPLKAGATLTVVHVLPPAHNNDEARRLKSAARRSLAEATRTATRIARRAGLTPPGVEGRVVEGHPVVEILRCARRCRADLVVVGRHGERTFRDLLIGSTAERLIRAAERPVLVVGARVPVPYRRALVAVDMSKSAQHALHGARCLVAPRQPLTVLHAYSVPLEVQMRRAGVSDDQLSRYRAEYRRRAKEALDRFLVTCGDGVEPRRILRRGDARHAILDQVARGPVDLLALGTHGRTVLGRLLLGSVAEAVVRRARCDVLVAKRVD